MILPFGETEYRTFMRATEILRLRGYAAPLRMTEGCSRNDARSVILSEQSESKDLRDPQETPQLTGCLKKPTSGKLAFSNSQLQHSVQRDRARSRSTSSLQAHTHRHVHHVEGEAHDEDAKEGKRTCNDRQGENSAQRRADLPVKARILHLQLKRRLDALQTRLRQARKPLVERVPRRRGQLL